MSISLIETTRDSCLKAWHAVKPNNSTCMLRAIPNTRTIKTAFCSKSKLTKQPVDLRTIKNFRKVAEGQCEEERQNEHKQTTLWPVRTVGAIFVFDFPFSTNCKRGL